MHHCPYCDQSCQKYGTSKTGVQRFFCTSCQRTHQDQYKYKACRKIINTKIIRLVKESCGIRSIARILQISATTVISRIKSISKELNPLYTLGDLKDFEVDELRTFVKRKDQECWVMYGLDRETGYPMRLSVGRRNKINLRYVIGGILLSNPRYVYTDGLDLYEQLIPKEIHKQRPYSINIIERKNLSLRTQLKRLSRKTICFSKSIGMLEACVRICFWAN